MMRATYISISGFLVELEGVNLLFDYWRGPIPELGSKPLLVFVSHRHIDHFHPDIFKLDDGTRPVQFYFDTDFPLDEMRAKRWNLSRETWDKCRQLPGDARDTCFGAVIETLRSTDKGVAYLVTAEGKTVFHAGDLNWWYWEDESQHFLEKMERDFKEYAEPLRGRHIDLAMLPMDPMLRKHSHLGPQYFLELADIDRFLPMHQWGEYAETDRFMERCPHLADRTVPVRARGQVFDFSEEQTGEGV